MRAWSGALAALLGLAGLLPAAARLNADKEGLAIRGYDPVAYVRLGKAMKGRARLDASYGGATFHFLTDPNRALFQKEPKAYLPAYGGWCAYAMASGDFVNADPGSFKRLSGTTYLFRKGWLGDDRKKWDQDQARLKAAADAHWKRLNEAPSSPDR